MRHIRPITSWHLLAGVRTSGLPNDTTSPFPPDYALLAGVSEPLHYLMKNETQVLKWAGDSRPPSWADIIQDAEDLVSRYVAIEADQPVWVTPYYPVNGWKERVDVGEQAFMRGEGVAVRITSATRALINDVMEPAALRDPYQSVPHNMRKAYDRMVTLRNDDYAQPIVINSTRQLIALYMGSALMKNADVLTKDGVFTPEALVHTKAYLQECYMTAEGMMAYRSRKIHPLYDIQGVKHMRSDGSHAQSAFRVRAYFDLPLFSQDGSRAIVIEVPAYRAVAFAFEQGFGQQGSSIGETFNVFPQNGRLDDPSLSNLVVLPPDVQDWDRAPALPRFNHTDLRMVYSERITQARWMDMLTNASSTKVMDVGLFDANYIRPDRSKPGPKGPRNAPLRDLVKPTDGEIKRSKAAGGGLNTAARPIIATPVSDTAMLRTEGGAPVVLPSVGNVAKYGFTKTAVHRCLQGKQSEHKGFKFTYVGGTNESLPM